MEFHRRFLKVQFVQIRLFFRKRQKFTFGKDKKFKIFIKIRSAGIKGLFISTDKGILFYIKKPSLLLHFTRFFYSTLHFIHLIFLFYYTIYLFIFTLSIIFNSVADIWSWISRSTEKCEREIFHGGKRWVSFLYSGMCTSLLRVLDTKK